MAIRNWFINFNIPTICACSFAHFILFDFIRCPNESHLIWLNRVNASFVVSISSKIISVGVNCRISMDHCHVTWFNWQHIVCESNLMGLYLVQRLDVGRWRRVDDDFRFQWSALKERERDERQKTKGSIRNRLSIPLTIAGRCRWVVWATIHKSFCPLPLSPILPVFPYCVH